MSAYVIHACAVLQNFIMITRLQEENDDHLFEEPYPEEIQGERDHLGLEWEEQDDDHGKVRLINHKTLFKQLNKL